MLDAMLKILPLLLIFMVGYGAKKIGLLSSKDGGTLLKAVFSIGAPALIFTSILKVKLDPSLFWLCLLAPAIVAVTSLIGFLLWRSSMLKVPMKTFGAMLIGTMIMNLGFVIPFVQNLYGSEGLARLMLIDAVNALMSFTVIYIIAVNFGHDQPKLSFVAKKLVTAPPLWGLVIALIYKTFGVIPPVPVMDALSLIASFVGPLLLIALGLMFNFKLQRPKLIVVPLVLRFVIGGIVGFGFVKLLGLHGLTAEIALLASVAPIGYYSLAIAERENLDTEFASSQVSVALLVALIASPFVVQLVSVFAA